MSAVRNQSVEETTWSEDDLTFVELIRQAYRNCVISAGTVAGHPVDTLYLKLERGGQVDTFLLLRPDEAAALAWRLTGALWSVEVARGDERV